VKADAVVVAGLAVVMSVAAGVIADRALYGEGLYLWERMAFLGVSGVLIANGAVAFRLAWELRK
jgi:hypothetical protein